MLHESPLFVLGAQINQHKKQDAARSCLEQLAGLVYHPDSDSLAALEKLYAESRCLLGARSQLYSTASRLRMTTSAETESHIAALIHNDQQALIQRNEVSRVFSDIAENGVLLIKGRVGLAVTLGTYALKHIKPTDTISDAALGFGAGIVEGTAFRAGAHIAGRATHHAGLTIMRYVKDAVRTQLEAAENFYTDALCTHALKEWKPLLPETVIHLLPETVIHRPPASATEAFNVVSEVIGRTPAAASTGPLFIAEHNVQYGNIEKALLYRRSYDLMFSRAHLLILPEVDPEFCRAAAESIDYKWYASRVNSRGQGLGLLLHPRLEIVGEPVTLESIAQVHHIPDLRPGFMVHLKDTQTGAQFDAVAVHLKSMRGGNYTHGVRYTQTAELAGLVRDCPTVVGGDWNFFLNRQEREMTPLARAGFQLVDPENNVPTHEFGGRLDGFMTRNVPWAFSNCDVFNFWRCLPNRSFSDHGMLRTRMDVK